MKLSTRVLSATALMVLAALLAACNTTRGVGADIENAGEGLKKSAERNGAE